MLLLIVINVIASYKCLFVSLFLHSLTNLTIVSYILLSSNFKNISAFERAIWAYYKRASAAPLVGQSCLWSTSISLRSLITSFYTMWSVISSLSTLHVKLRTIPIMRSLNLLRYTLFYEFLDTFLYRACSSSNIITSNIFLSFIKWATFSMQFSFAVKSRRTVAAGYLI